jgi:hypothetical protein
MSGNSKGQTREVTICSMTRSPELTLLENWSVPNIEETDDEEEHIYRGTYYKGLKEHKVRLSALEFCRKHGVTKTPNVRIQLLVTGLQPHAPSP